MAQARMVAGGGEKSSDVGHSLKIKPIGLDLGEERKEEIDNSSKYFALRT